MQVASSPILVALFAWKLECGKRTVKIQYFGAILWSVSLWNFPSETNVDAFAKKC